MNEDIDYFSFMLQGTLDKVKRHIHERTTEMKQAKEYMENIEGHEKLIQNLKQAKEKIEKILGEQK